MPKPMARVTSWLLLAVLILAGCQPLQGERLGALRLGRATPEGTPRPAASAPPTMGIPTLRPTPRATRDAYAPATPAPDAQEWLKRAGLSPDTPQGEDWEAIRKAALAEGTVLLYSDSSRGATASEALMATYPGLAVDAHVLGSHDAYLQVSEAGGPEAGDLYLGSDAPGTLAALAEHKLWAYVPADLVGVVPDGSRAPLLTHHWTALMFFRSGDASQAAPPANWWALTRPAWRGRVALSDPILDERTLYALTALTAHGEAFARAYQDEFGSAVTLDADCPNAAYQWIKALLLNQPKLLESDAAVAGLVGNPPAGEVWMGLCSSEQYAKVSRGELTMSPLVEISPLAGVRLRTYVAIVDRAPHPQAAKLLLRWLMGDPAGGQGYRPWYEPGTYPARTDVPDPPGAIARATLEPRLCELEAPFIATHLQAVRDLIAAHIGRAVGGR